MTTAEFEFKPVTLIPENSFLEISANTSPFNFNGLRDLKWIYKGWILNSKGEKIAEISDENNIFPLVARRLRTSLGSIAQGDDTLVITDTNQFPLAIATYPDYPVYLNFALEGAVEKD